MPPLLSHAPEPVSGNHQDRAPHLLKPREATAMNSLSSAGKSRAHSLQLEKVKKKQQRPSMAKNQLINLKKKKTLRALRQPFLTLSFKKPIPFIVLT